MLSYEERYGGWGGARNFMRKGFIRNRKMSYFALLCESKSNDSLKRSFVCDFFQQVRFRCLSRGVCMGYE